MSELIRVRVWLPHDVCIWQPPDGPFLDKDGEVTGDMLNWLESLAEEMISFQHSPVTDEADPAYWVNIRTRNNAGRAMFAAAWEYANLNDQPGQWDPSLDRKDHIGTQENPVVCMFSANREGVPDGPIFYLSDFRNGGEQAIIKLLLITNIINNLPLPK